MKVEFCKTAERRYAIKLLRDGLPALEMNPAPGFDDLMPHDLCHFIVEQVLRIENAVFGGAASGSSTTFRHHPSETSNTKNDSRQRRKAKQKGKQAVKEHSEDYYRSERATFVCWQNWLSESSDIESKRRAADMKDAAESILRQMSAAERAIYTKANLEKVRLRMSELSQQWQSLKPGDSMTVEWYYESGD
jgi:hypothetical protein